MADLTQAIHRGPSTRDFAFRGLTTLHRHLRGAQRRSNPFFIRWWQWMADLTQATHRGPSTRDFAFRGLTTLHRHCEERSDEAIHPFFLWQHGLLRFARNDVNSCDRLKSASRRDHSNSDLALRSKRVSLHGYRP